MAEPEIISPRGVPQMRIDWIADVARRLAEVGLPRLRALDEEQHGHLTDLVDGESWAFQLMKFSAEHETTVEFDAELWAPADDRAKPTLRAGFALAPRWEEGHGNTTLVRVEIGPRGAVTFDPQNWMLSIPLDEVGSPSPAGVAAGATVFGYSPPEAGHDAPAALRLAGVAVVFTDMAVLPSLLAQPRHQG